MLSSITRTLFCFCHWFIWILSKMSLLLPLFPFMWVFSSYIMHYWNTLDTTCSVIYYYYIHICYLRILDCSITQLQFYRLPFKLQHCLCVYVWENNGLLLMIFTLTVRMMMVCLISTGTDISLSLFANFTASVFRRWPSRYFYFLEYQWYLISKSSDFFCFVS